jgi:hypothetical protein
MLKLQKDLPWRIKILSNPEIIQKQEKKYIY